MNSDHTTIRRGDDFDCGVLGEDSLATAGIHVGNHLNAIECHGATLDEAQQLRERVLALLVQRDVEYAAALSLAPEPHSTHRVWRGSEWLPCYCPARDDHYLGAGHIQGA